MPAQTTPGPGPDAPLVTRRQILGAAAVLAIGALAGCGESGPSGTSGDPLSTTPAPIAPTPTNLPRRDSGPAPTPIAYDAVGDQYSLDGTFNPAVGPPWKRGPHWVRGDEQLDFVTGARSGTWNDWHTRWVGHNAWCELFLTEDTGAIGASCRVLTPLIFHLVGDEWHPVQADVQRQGAVGGWFDFGPYRSITPIEFTTVEPGQEYECRLDPLHEPDHALAHFWWPDIFPSIRFLPETRAVHISTSFRLSEGAGRIYAAKCSGDIFEAPDIDIPDIRPALGHPAGRSLVAGEWTRCGYTAGLDLGELQGNPPPIV